MRLVIEGDPEVNYPTLPTRTEELTAILGGQLSAFVPDGLQQSRGVSRGGVRALVGNAHFAVGAHDVGILDACDTGLRPRAGLGSGGRARRRARAIPAADAGEAQPTSGPEQAGGLN
ncbi:hypothetical protein [Mycobacterium kiyosense]